METKLEQLRCGQCGEKKHKLYLRPNGEIVVECVNCKSRSEITITHPKIVIGHNDGDGTICIF
jgi:NAD-dependent SIR2 family protein deacetylase